MCIRDSYTMSPISGMFIPDANFVKDPQDSIRELHKVACSTNEQSGRFFYQFDFTRSSFGVSTDQVDWTFGSPCGLLNSGYAFENENINIIDGEWVRSYNVTELMNTVRRDLERDYSRIFEVKEQANEVYDDTPEGDQIPDHAPPEKSLHNTDPFGSQYAKTKHPLGMSGATMSEMKHLLKDSS
eukprot:TRINITY_DN7521_c0_g1_i11.p1 TRINITY_DN7521_c0_g1~~TRINITY_DN7521_c0_g1_i11.p1  ORF type:complete len:184 (+),score=3.87 TRINITY_DN7521_c0_g1_i11:86-637(+)